jgi:hypothetical protein
MHPVVAKYPEQAEHWSDAVMQFAWPPVGQYEGRSQAAFRHPISADNAFAQPVLHGSASAMQPGKFKRLGCPGRR